ncbi:MerR family transcriptional regulator [Planococcus sp. 1R117A]|uniref:MerR family transcriptional regulator n=1 Tax=Planococcus sp. 1R117A TaxID=3447020 RepID=UPI003EDB7D44
MYNIKAAAKLLDMPKVTIRSWETRYNAITPARTESGHRLYSDQNLEDLKWLKIQVQDRGIKISEAVKQLHASKRKPAEKVVVPENPLDAEPFSKQIQELYLAASEMDTERFNYLLDLNFSLFHYRTVFFSLIIPLMIRIGDEWKNGSLTVAHEHMISHIVHQRFAHFFRVFPTSAELPKVMALCPSGEHHQLGLLLFTLFLRENGFPVMYFGQDTPLEGLAETASQQQTEIVCMSISDPDLRQAVDHYIEQLSQENPRLRFLIGGQGVEKQLHQGQAWYLGESYESWQQWLDEQKEIPLSRA